MARSVSGLNIEIKGNANNFEKEINRVNKSIDSLNKDNKGLQQIGKSGAGSFSDVNKEIQKTISNLYKLRAELKKGGTTSISDTFKSIEESKAKIIAGSGLGEGILGGAIVSSINKSANTIANEGTRAALKYREKLQKSFEKSIATTVTLSGGLFATPFIKTTDKISGVDPYTVFFDFFDGEYGGFKSRKLNIDPSEYNNIVDLRKYYADSLLFKEFLNNRSIVTKAKFFFSDNYTKAKFFFSDNYKKANKTIPGLGLVDSIGTNTIGRFTGGGPLGKALGGVGAGVGIVAGIGQLFKQYKENTREFARDFGQPQTFRERLFQLPGVGSIASALGEAGALLGFDTSLSDAKIDFENASKDAELLNKSLDNFEQKTRTIARAIREYSDQIDISRRNRLGSIIGGRAGRVFDIETNRDNQLRTELNKRNDRVSDLELERNKKIRDYRKEIAQADREGLTNRSNILRGELKRELFLIDKELDIVKNGYRDVTKEIIISSNQERLLALGMIRDSKSIQNSLEELQNKIAEVGDEYGLVAFNRLNPNAKDRNDFIAATQSLINAQGRVASIENYKKGLETIYRLETNIAIAREKDSLKRIELEVEFDRLARIRAETENLSGEALLEAIGRINKLSEQRLKLEKELDKITRGNAIKESIKTAADRLKEALENIGKSLIENEITDDIAKKAIDEARNTFIDSQKTDRPELLLAGSGTSLRNLAIAYGRAFDPQNPQIVLQRRTNDILEDIRDGIVNDDIVTLGAI